MDGSLHWLLLALPLALIGILLVSRLVGGARKSAAKSKANAARRQQATGSSQQNVQIKQARDARPGAPLSPEERDAMLDGVKNLARENPGKVAGLLRNWMEEDGPG